MVTEEHLRSVFITIRGVQLATGKMRRNAENCQRRNGASARVDTQMAQPERVVNECGHNNRMFSKARS